MTLVPAWSGGLRPPVGLQPLGQAGTVTVPGLPGAQLEDTGLGVASACWQAPELLKGQVRPPGRGGSRCSGYTDIQNEPIQEPSSDVPAGIFPESPTGRSHILQRPPQTLSPMPGTPGSAPAQLWPLD